LLPPISISVTVTVASAYSSSPSRVLPCIINRLPVFVFAAFPTLTVYSSWMSRVDLISPSPYCQSILHVLSAVSLLCLHLHR